MERSPLDRLRMVRSLRVKPKELSIVPDLTQVLGDFKREQAAVGGLTRAWSGICPPELAALSRVESISPGGIVVIKAADASAAWMLDQWLRGGGGEAALRAASTKSVRRIRVVVGALGTMGANDAAVPSKPPKGGSSGGAKKSRRGGPRS
jgi:hypothetical protein